MNNILELIKGDIPTVLETNEYIDKNLLKLENIEEYANENKIYCFAGPNGSGKSTLIKKLENYVQYKYINADNITRVKFFNIEDYYQRNLKGAQYADELRNICLNKNISFSFETVLSTHRNLELLKKAKEKGYEIEIHYVLTKDPNINVERVKKRVNEGGHDVPSVKIIERYHRCMKLLPEVLQTSDNAIVYDNSEKYKVVCSKRDNVYYFIDRKDEWTQENLIKPLKEKGASIKLIS